MEETRMAYGFGYGVVATVVMSIVMIFGVLSGLSPIPEPIPKAIVTSVLGITAPKPLVVGLAVGLHLTYGGVFGALLARFTRTVTVLKGASLGVVLWMLMQLGLLPVLGWGIFGTTVTPKIAVATLVLHLVYGVVLGWTLDRNPTRPRTSGPEGVS